jgi:DNA-binding response OmpR family regulator
LLTSIRLQVRRLDRLVRNLLDLSRLEAGAAQPELELWTVDGLVGRALKAMCPGSERVTVSLPAEPLTVRVDAAQLEHALVNLLENALAYSALADPVEIRAEASGNEVIVRVVDRGPGISAQEREAIFAPFRQGSRGGERGSGLGLAIARGFVEGERRTPVGRVGTGSGCHVRAGPACGWRPGGRDLSGTRVLVVDDEPQILRALQMKLRGAGYAVDTATTAQEALAKAAMRPPEAIILDVLLPDGSGTDVCRELRAWSAVPILVLSAVGEEREKIAALDAGADAYVTKPFSGDQLLARLRAALRRTAPSGRPVLEVGALRIDLEKRTVTMAASVTAVTVIEIPPLLPLDAHMRDEEEEARRLLVRAEALGDAYGVTVVLRSVRARDPATAILEQIDRDEFDLVVIGARRRERASKRAPAFGATVQHVLRKAPCRVLVVAAPRA